MNSEILKKIERILFPNGARSRNQRNDIGIVYHARYYDSILITRDGASKSQPGGILGHKVELAEIGSIVMNEIEAVGLVHARIKDRDEMAIKAHKNFGNPLPEWVGKD